MKISARIPAMVAILVLASAPAHAGDAAKQIAAAATHAGLAAGSDSEKMVQTHLQHVINCLEGPSGADFNAGPGNPCKDLGAGAIPDSAPEKRVTLESAAAIAKKVMAMADANIVKAKAFAAAIQANLLK
jgi:hypothetical protein